MTIGEKISYNAKAIAALITAVLTLVAAVLASVPADIIPAQGAIWIAVAISFATAVSVWLTTNGPKIGAAVDTFGHEAGPIVDDVRKQLDEIAAAVKAGKDVGVKVEPVE